jgi:chromosome segregation ATPase
MAPLTPVREAPIEEKKRGGMGSFVTGSNFISKTASNASTSTVAVSMSTDENQQSPSHEVSKLRSALQEAHQRDSSSKAALAKSDAVILELRSSIRQLKRSVEQLQHDKDVADDNYKKLQDEFNRVQQTASESLQKEKEIYSTKLNQLQSKLQISESQSKDMIVGELQVQLDRAHAQILTADMVRKELEDTLEAEQYTWELRVQDQERHIMQLQEDCKLLQEDLNQCRTQWKEAEQGWSEEVKTLRNQSNRDSDASGRLNLLEKEREELQACLDEAMKELEAVDQELRQAPNMLQPLQDVYRWLLDRYGKTKQNIPNDANQLVQSIEEIIEASSNDSLKIAELEAQISVYRGDLKAREESSAELRASLKEAVALLKPLQDAVAKTDQEKQELEDELEQLRKERNSFMSKSTFTSPISTSRTMPSGEEQFERDTRTRRDQKQEELKRMLSSAQSKFQGMHKDKLTIMDENKILRRQIEDLENKLSQLSSIGKDTMIRDAHSDIQKSKINQLEKELNNQKEVVKQRDFELESLRGKMEDIKALGDLATSIQEKRDLENQLHQVKKELLFKTEAERMLNDSLKEALGLLKPLQTHLETSERERKQLTRQLKVARKKLEELERKSDHVEKWDVIDDQGSDKEVIMRGLPQNSRHQKEVLQWKTRHDELQQNLDSAKIENNALVDALKRRESKERELIKEISTLRKKLEKSNHELENAKFIATSALMKVEELTMADLSSAISREIVASKSNQGSPQTLESQRIASKRVSLDRDVTSLHEETEPEHTVTSDRDTASSSLSGSLRNHQSPDNNSQRGNSAHRVTWKN